MQNNVIGCVPKQVGGNSAGQPLVLREAQYRPALVSLATVQAIHDELLASPVQPAEASEGLLRCVFGGPGGRGDLVGTDEAASMTDEMLAVIIEAEQRDSAANGGPSSTARIKADT